MSEGMSRFAAKLRSGDSENHLVVGSSSGRRWTGYNNIVISTGRISPRGARDSAASRREPFGLQKAASRPPEQALRACASLRDAHSSLRSLQIAASRRKSDFASKKTEK